MNDRVRILAVDDDPDLLKLLQLRLSGAGYDVVTAADAAQALTAFAVSRPQVVITDLRMPGMDGMALFDAIRGQGSNLPVIVLTAHGTIPDAVAATQRGVFGYLEKPVDPRQLLATVEAALSSGACAAEASEDWQAGIITRSTAMEEVLAKVRLVAGSDAAVLIMGESGTGKELLARAIHRASRRAGAPFIAINCGAIPETLLESELFGYVKGSFTGAARDHTGLIAAANGGTLFLDEIGDMPLALQVKLLRVLQEREVRPLGATQSQPVDVRIISATHRDLKTQLGAGGFREDLYYRLNVVSLTLPALAERREDITVLAAHFLHELSKEYGKPINGFAPEALQRLSTAAWPGNVRQLRNVVEQAVALSTTPVVPASLIEHALQTREDSSFVPFDDARRDFERDYLVQLLKLTSGSVSRAAKLAGRNRTDFYKLLGRHQIDPSVFKGEKHQ
jgi:two-component system response regulator GlrR